MTTCPICPIKDSRIRELEAEIAALTHDHRPGRRGWFSEEEVMQIRLSHLSGMSAAALALELNCSGSTIRAIIRGDSYRWVKFPYLAGQKVEWCSFQRDLA